MSVIVTDRGFGPDDWAGTVAPLPERTTEPGVDVPSDAAWPDVAALLPSVPGSPSEDLNRRSTTGGDAVPDGMRGTGEPVGEAALRRNGLPELIRIAFPAFNDGRGFTLARRLRQAGYSGRLRAHGHILADQYAMARRSGFDEVEIGDDLARRQPEEQWLARAHWRAHDYQSRLGKRSSVAAR